MSSASGHSGSSKKRTCHLCDALKLEFPFYINSVSDDKTVLQCSVCSSTFSIASGERTAITEHLQAKKHKNAVVAKSVRKFECLLTV